MRALVFLSCVRACSEPSQCVIHCAAEQVVGESDRLRAETGTRLDVVQIHVPVAPRFCRSGRRGCFRMGFKLWSAAGGGT